MIALLALSMAAASFVVAAVFFAVLGIILALWETQRVLAFVLAAGVFAAFDLSVDNRFGFQPVLDFVARVKTALLGAIIGEFCNHRDTHVQSLV